MRKQNLLTIKEFSVASQLSVSTLRRLVRQGRIRFLQPAGKSGKLLFPPDALECLDEDGPSNGDSDRSLPGRAPGWMS